MKEREAEKLNPKKRPGIFRISLLKQVAFFFALAVLITGVISFFTLKAITERSIRKQREELAIQIVKSLAVEMYQYETMDWLLEYWAEHAADLDVEYGTYEKTLKKEEEFGKKHPEFILGAPSLSEVQAMSEEDQKLYAEIMYSWITDEFNMTKMVYEISYIYIIRTDPEYQEDIYLISGAAYDQSRGSGPEDAYTLGVTVGNTEAQKKSLETAASQGTGLFQTDDYIDYYFCMLDEGGGKSFVGVSYDLGAMKASAKQDTLHGVINFVGMQIALSAFCLILLFFFTIRPVRRIQKRVRSYKDNRDPEEILRRLSHVQSRNEIGELRDDISECVIEIEDYLETISEITSEQERIRTELSVATRIQEGLVPKTFPPFPERKEFDLYASMTPAKEVGGDFYDYFLVDEDHLAMVIADVSGKGVPAALFMATSMSLIRSRTMLGGSPSEILADVNEQLCEGNNSDFFVTVWLAILQISTGEGVAANAGHEHPMLRRKGGSFEPVKYRHSPAVATMKGIPFREHTFRLEPGDRLFVFTDGVPEATDAKEELFGEDRTVEALNRYADQELSGLLEGVKEEIDRFTLGAEQFDDITMLALDYFGPTRR